MDVIKAIEKRTSIRKYSNKAVPRKLINEVINAGRLAPSGHNTQPWKFAVIGKKTLAKLWKNKAFCREFVSQAPAAIVCSANPRAYGKRDPVWDQDNKSRAALRDLSIASAFMVLRATELGLGTCYIGWVKGAKIKKELGIPKEFIVPYIITLGYCAESPEPRARKKLSEITEYRQ